MSQLGRDALKEYFQKGDFPTSSQMADFIDSVSNTVDDFIIRELMFYDNQEIIIKHIEAETIQSNNISSEITSIEYSLNGGGFISPSYPIVLSANDKTVWRVSVYASGTSGFVRLNSKLNI
jgi:hypothetical protein